MNSKDLFDIIDDKDRKLTIEEIKDIVSVMKKELEFAIVRDWGTVLGSSHYEYGFQQREINMCLIILELFKHLEDKGA